MQTIHRMKRDEQILSFNGVLSTEEMDKLLKRGEEELDQYTTDPNIKKRTYSIFIEIVQNLFHHAGEGIESEKNEKNVELYLFRDDYNFYIKSANFIEKNKIPPLHRWMDKVNSLSSKEIKELYTEYLQRATFSEKGGANLGMIEIVRKSKNNISYRFQKLDEKIYRVFLMSVLSHEPFLPLVIPGSKNTPGINFDQFSGLLKFSGRCIPENANSIFHPLMSWLNTYVNQAARITTFEVYIDYMNSSSSKFLLEVFKRLQMIEFWDNKKVNVRWIYDKDDDDMLETGKDYQEICELDFELIEK